MKVKFFCWYIVLGGIDPNYESCFFFVFKFVSYTTFYAACPETLWGNSIGWWKSSWSNNLSKNGWAACKNFLPLIILPCYLLLFLWQHSWVYLVTQVYFYQLITIGFYSFFDVTCVISHINAWKKVKLVRRLMFFFTFVPVHAFLPFLKSLRVSSLILVAWTASNLDLWWSC